MPAEFLEEPQETNRIGIKICNADILRRKFIVTRTPLHRKNHWGSIARQQENRCLVQRSPKMTSDEKVFKALPKRTVNTVFNNTLQSGCCDLLPFEHHTKMPLE